MAQRQGKYIGEDLEVKLAQFSLGYFTAEQFNRLIDLIEKEIIRHPFTKGAEANLIRLLQAHFDKATLLLDCLKYPHHLEILIVIATHSNYLTDILVLNPEYFHWIINPVNFNQKTDQEFFKDSLRSSVQQFKTFNGKVNFIRRFKRKEILRIGLNDLLGNITLEEVTERLSYLAKGITATLFELCYNEVKEKNSVSLPEDNYCIISLGKLGGDELNYSSDIDLMIFYRDEIEYKKRFYSEYLTEAIYLFIENASAVTSGGFIYRVDFRLRPDGRTSHLTRSVQDYLNYYESRGEDWERQMLIKCGFVGGSRKLYERFINYLQPFIYPSTFVSSPTEQIKLLKKNIEKNLTTDSNIKLSAGGIRDIEFSVQALQLLNGGKNKDIRGGNTLNAAAALKERSILTISEAVKLTEAYRLFRKIEHYLQLMNDKQTHTIPSEGELLKKLAAYLKFNSSISLIKEVRKQRKNVEIIFHSILGDDFNTRKSPVSDIKFRNKKKSEQDLKFLSEGKGVIGEKLFDSITIDLFARLTDRLITELALSPDPDMILSNFVRVIKNAKFPSIWYKELSDKKFFSHFLKILSSQKCVDLFAEDHDLRDNLLSRKVFEKIDIMNVANLKSILFFINVQFNVGMIDAAKASMILSRYFNKRIGQIAVNYVNEKEIGEYFIAGMGSLGSEEMTFSSDIDLIFCVGSLDGEIDKDHQFQGLIKELRREFPGFEVDCRLRPEGKNNILVSDIEGYINYLSKRARVWELQALTKINFVAGSNKLFTKLMREFENIVKMKEVNYIKKEIAEMRSKMLSQSFFDNVINLKKIKGGKTDIEFLIQYLILTNSGLIKKSRGKNISKRLKLIEEAYNNSEDFSKLSKAFLFLKNIEMIIQSTFNTTSAILPAEDYKLKMIGLKVGTKEGNELLEQVKSKLKFNSQLFNKYLN